MIVSISPHPAVDEWWEIRAELRPISGYRCLFGVPSFERSMDEEIDAQLNTAYSMEGRSEIGSFGLNDDMYCDADYYLYCLSHDSMRPL